MSPAQRWALVEYGQPSEILSSIAMSVGLTRAQVKELLMSSGERAGKTLGFSKNPISISGDGVRAIDVAGILRAAPGIEIEIAPKFLGLDSTNPRWREDFFFLATLSRHGRLLPADRLAASKGERGDLHTLVARAMTDMFWDNHRRPLRSYRTVNAIDFAFDGDIEMEEVFQPGMDGYAQTTITYDRYNIYNGTILAAAKGILPNLRDPSVIAKLQRLIQSMTPQRGLVAGTRARSIPSRARRWQPLYDLSVEVLKGFGLSFKTGSALAPGYLLNTWRVWEDLVGIGLQLGFGRDQVRLQKASSLGVRNQIVGGKLEGRTTATVTPDAMISNAICGDKNFLVDAKYKGKVENGRNRISESDLYEALAFLRATSSNISVLAYPLLSPASSTLGEAKLFEHIVIDDLHILGLEIETKGISSAGGIMNFSKRLMRDMISNIERLVCST